MHLVHFHTQQPLVMILSTIALSALLGLTTAQTGTYAPPLTPNPSEEICPQFQFDSESRLDCSRTTCLAPLNSTRNCLQYCEVRRTGFVGPVGIPQTSWNETTNAWEAKDLPVGDGTPGGGELVDVVTGIDQTSWMENVAGMQAMKESVGYECTCLSSHFPPVSNPQTSNSKIRDRNEKEKKQKQKLTNRRFHSTNPQNTYNQDCERRHRHVRKHEEVAPRPRL